ncbi:MAG: RIP metalloprotease RseP [Desulfovibrionaceae bacterium]
MLITVISVILVLGGLIFFHELGHFAVARAFGMGVSTFSLGFGPKLWSRTWGKTEYRLSAVPLGGYVALVGEEDDAELPAGFTPEESFNRRPPWQRLLVVAAGPVANFLLAWFLCWGLAFAYGQAEILPSVGEVQENSPAAAAGLRAGDTVLNVNGTPVRDWMDMSTAIAASKGAPLSVEVARGAEAQQEQVTLHVVPQAAKSKTIFGEEQETWRIGVRASGKHRIIDLGFWESAHAGAVRTWDMVALTWMGFVKLAQRVVPLDQVGGPIMIAQMVGQQASEGLSNVLALAALISINLAVLNLLPIPVLDGGQIVFCALETVMRRPLGARFREYTMKAGWIFLMGLMVLATFNDVWRIVKGWSIFGGFGG